MGYLCAPQILGLVRGEPKQGQRHRANGEFILKELCEERASSSPTLDRNRSANNTYYHADGSKLGTDTWKSMCEEADAYRSKVTLRDGTVAERGLRKDAVIGWAAIIKPSTEMITELNMDDSAIEDFCFDGFEALCTIEPRVFRSENVKAIAAHRDEDATHMHFTGVSKDQDGRYCGNLIDAALLNRINQEFPRLMREKGWQLDDLDVTDWKRFKDDEAYREERKAKRKQQGQDVRRYARQQAKKAKEEAAEWKQIAENEKKLCAETENAKQAIQMELDALCVEKEKAKQELESVRQDMAHEVQELGGLKAYNEFRKAKRDEKARQEAEREAQRERERQEKIAADRERLKQEMQERVQAIQNAPETPVSVEAIPNTSKAQTPLKNDCRSSEAYAKLKKANSELITTEEAVALLLEP